MPALRDKLGLLRGLLSREFAYAGPFAVTVDVTRRCNLRCVACPIHAPHLDRSSSPDAGPEDLDVEMFESLCRELQDMKTRSLIFCGDGEPLLHPCFPDLLAAAKRARLRTVLLTNGTLLDEEKANALVRGGLDVLRVSLWAASPDVYERCYPGTKPDSFGKVLNGLRLTAGARERARSAVPRIVLHCVINRHNFRQVEALADVASSARCDAVSLSPLYTSFGQLSSLSVPRDEEEPLLAALSALGRRLRASGLDHDAGDTILRYRLARSTRRRIPCYVPWIHPRVKVDGTVRPCNPCPVSLGNLREQSFRQIWNGAPYRDFRKKLRSADFAVLAAERCDCTYCCHVIDNLRVHRVYRWFSLFGALGFGNHPGKS